MIFDPIDEIFNENRLCNCVGIAYNTAMTLSTSDPVKDGGKKNLICRTDGHSESELTQH